MPGTLPAQTTHPIDEARENARSHVGPFYITPALMLRDLGIDTNVFNEAARSKSDFTLTIGPRADIAVPFGHRLLLTSSVGADFVYYRKYSSERSVSPGFASRAVIFLNRISFFGEGSYARHRQRPNFEIDTRSLRTERSRRGGVGYQFSPKLGIEVSGQRSDVKYAAGETFLDVSLQETLNRGSDTIATAVKYAMTPLTTIVLRVDRSEDRFEFSHERDADTLRVMPGVAFNTRALISGSANIGVRRFSTKRDALEDFNGLVASATLAYTLLGRTAFVVSGERDVTYSFERFQPYYVVNSYGLDVRHRLPGRFDVMAGVGRYQYTYRDLVVSDPLAAPNPASPDRRVDITRIYSISFGYDLGLNVRLGFGTTCWVRDSNSARDREYDALRSGVILSYGF
jgi:Putative beta-barrel porin 2